VFLEPEDEQISAIYCNGISTSLPKDIQQQMLRLIPGTENAHIVHFGYAIEYDFCPPTQLYDSLETRKISGLFLAGQINGTSGYEEAAGQGIIAGINAARKLQGREPIILGRQQAYIGVMIDDLLTRGIDEPYRMFTSRAEYRLSLRADNADRRLTELGRSVGLVGHERYEKFQKKVQGIERLKNYLRSTRLPAGGGSLWEHLRRPDAKFEILNLSRARPRDSEFQIPAVGRDVLQAVIIDAKYDGYLAKQERLVANFSTLENKKIPPDLDYK